MHTIRLTPLEEDAGHPAGQLPVPAGGGPDPLRRRKAAGGGLRHL